MSKDGRAGGEGEPTGNVARSPSACCRPLLVWGSAAFFDGIIHHQLLQWHHMVSNWYPINSLDNLKLNTRWHGAFHSLTYLFVLGGLVVLWRRGHLRHRRWQTRSLIGTLLLGWGLFNVIEGLVDHQLLGIHHVNETVNRTSQWAWDAGFLSWGAVLIPSGWDGRAWTIVTGQGTSLDAQGRPAFASPRRIGSGPIPPWRSWLFPQVMTVDEVLSFRCG